MGTIVQRRTWSTVAEWMSVHAHRLTVLKLILLVALISTGLHYPHNYVQVHHYPQSELANADTTRLGILIVWPTLTAVGALGLWLYARRVYGLAYVCIAAYSFLGIVSLCHFVDGSPDIPAFWYATIFTDAVVGFAALAFVAWSVIASSGDGESRRV
jgi:hypothetical protein